MKWFSSLFGKEKEEAPHTVSVSDAERLIDQKTKPQQEELAITLSEIYAAINEKKAALAGSNSALEKAQVGEEIHDRLLRAALTNRTNIVNQISAITSSIEVPQAKGYPEALEFYDNSSRTIAECTQRSTVSYQYVKLVFEEESRDVREKAKQLEEAFLSLKKELDLRKESFGKAKDLAEKIRRIKELREKRKEQEEKAKGSAEKAEKLKKELEEAKKNLEQLEASEQSQNFEALKKELEAADAGLKKAGEDALSIVSPVERVLKKFRKAAEEGKARYSDLKLVGQYIENPAETLLLDSRLGICGMASEMRALAGTGELEKDPKKAEKLLQSLGELKPEKIRALQLRHESLHLKKNALRKKISESTVDTGKKAMERGINNISGQIGGLDAESRAARQQAAGLSAKIEELTAGLEEELAGFTGEKIVLEREGALQTQGGPE